MEKELRGRFQIKLDAKGRLNTPSALKSVAANTTFVLTNSQYQGCRCLDVYTLEEWQKLEEKIARMSTLKKEVQAFQRFYIAGGQKVDSDAQGRLLIPKSLREYANLQDHTVLVGMGTKFELWNQGDWDRIFNNLATQFEDTLGVIANMDMGDIEAPSVDKGVVGVNSERGGHA